jgi:hypothetical protein
MLIVGGGGATAWAKADGDPRSIAIVANAPLRRVIMDLFVISFFVMEVSPLA